MMYFRFSLSLLLSIIIVFCPRMILAGELEWPIDCIPGDERCWPNIGYPDTDDNGIAFNCSTPGYTGHQGTDISLRSWDKMDEGVAVFAAADGEVLWAFDGKYDHCPDLNNSDCQPPPNGWFEPGQSYGYRVCTPIGNFCNTGDCCCYWCFDGANVVVIKHSGIDGVFATRYDHLKTNSILVSPGDLVIAGQKIAEVGSAGSSTGPHLHFEVWGSGFYDLVDPWAGECGLNILNSLWKSEIPWNDSAINTPPNADAGFDETLTACDPVVLNAENSTDIDGHIVSYEWIIAPLSNSPGGVINRTGKIVNLGVLSPDSYLINLTIRDDNEGEDSDDKSVIVRQHNEWDINNDCKQGLEEIIHILTSLTE